MTIVRINQLTKDLVTDLNLLYQKAIESWDMSPLDVPKIFIFDTIYTTYKRYNINPTQKMIEDAQVLYQSEQIVNAIYGI